MDTRETIDQHANRWASLMKLFGLRERVLGTGEANEPPAEPAPKRSSPE